MSNPDDRDGRSPDRTLFEKRPETDTPRKRPGSRIPAGVYVGVALAVIVIVGIVLFVAASHTSMGGNGQTTSSGIVVLMSVVPTLLG